MTTENANCAWCGNRAEYTNRASQRLCFQCRVVNLLQEIAHMLKMVEERTRYMVP